MATTTSQQRIPTAAPGKSRIGWIGPGKMGRWMCEHVLNAGYTVKVYSRTKEKAQPLIDKGASFADSIAQVAENSDLVFLTLGFPNDVREVMYGAHGVLANCPRGCVVVDMTTSEPSLAKELAVAGIERNVYVLDAPVMGGEVGAREARLSVMIGGYDMAAQAALPCFHLMGNNVQVMGPAGSGQNAKLANQIAIAGAMIGVCESLMFGYRTGLPLETLIGLISTGGGGSWCISNHGPKILKRNFEPGLTVEHFVKDLGLALHEAEVLGISLPGLALAQQMYLSLKARGKAKVGTQALYLVLESLNGIAQS